MNFLEPVPGSLVDVHLDRPDFTLSVQLEWRDRVLVLFGPSGSGKSTLLECLLGLHPSARARVRLDGRWIADSERNTRLRVQDRGLGWVPQVPTLFPHLDVSGNLRFGVPRAGKRSVGTMGRASAGCQRSIAGFTSEQ